MTPVGTRTDEDEASRQRAIKRGGDSGPKNSLHATSTNGTGGWRVETAQEECKRGEADRVAQYVANWISVPDFCIEGRTHVDLTTSTTGPWNY